MESAELWIAVPLFLFTAFVVLYIPLSFAYKMIQAIVLTVRDVRGKGKKPVPRSSSYMREDSAGL